jgi:hypothetical protein
MVIVPSWDLIVVWNDSQALEEKKAEQERVMGLIRAAVGQK